MPLLTLWYFIDSVSFFQMLITPPPPQKKKKKKKKNRLIMCFNKLHLQKSTLLSSWVYGIDSCLMPTLHFAEKKLLKRIMVLILVILFTRQISRKCDKLRYLLEKMLLA